MEKEINHPGIVTDEVSLLPKSVAQIETAVPAFIGYTEKAFFGGHDLHSSNVIQPLEINSFAEYESVFGSAPEPASVSFELDNNNNIIAVKTEELSFLYYSVKLFFDNGGTTCLIVSVGSYKTVAGKISKQQLLKGLACLEKTDTPTLLVIPDAAKLSYVQAGELHAAMLLQSGKMKSRFALIDMVNGNYRMDDPENPVVNFRQYVGMDSLSYGAAYYPWLITIWNPIADSNTLLSARYFKNGVEVKEPSFLFKTKTIDASEKYGLFVRIKNNLNLPDLNSMTKSGKTAAYAIELYNYLKEFFNLGSNEAAFNDKDPFSVLHRNYIAKGSSFHSLLKRLLGLSLRRKLSLKPSDFIADFSPLTFPVHPGFIKKREKSHKQSSAGNLKSMVAEAKHLTESFFRIANKLQLSLQEQLKHHDKMYNSVVNAMEAHKVVVPPGGAVAGIMSQIDLEKGVWKAPANVSIKSVTGPAVDVLQHHQENLNVDVLEGKSVNGIRFFPGKGLRIWGARTLAGNDNKWRYINVRRFCIMVEQSVLEAIRPFSFEPNNEATWYRIRIMIDDFLNSLWRAGALKGTKPEQAYFVKLGLGESMSAEDIESGMMKLVAGLAVIKPAGYIILPIAQKMMTG